ncbi:MAG TPA: MlaD family protein [Bryobacteraceae bacterium]|nr:MlaD family protein [Bryobacteraceae bacterium]
MPTTSKSKWAQLKVGLMAMFALLLLAFLIILMSGVNPLFRRTTEVYTFLPDSVAMTEGATPVRLNGILIGKVKTVELSGSSDPARIVKLTLSIYTEDLTLVPVDSQAKLAQQNLLGSRYVNIKKGKSQQTIQAGAEIPSADTPEIEDIFAQSSSTLATLQKIMERVNGIIDDVQGGKGTIGALLVDRTLYNRAVEIVDDVKGLTEALNAPDSTMGRLIHEDTLYQDVRGTVAKIDTLIDGLNSGQGTAGKLLKDDALYNELHATLGDARKTIALINSGEGTVSKLLNSSQLHDQLVVSMGKLDTVLDKVNNGDGTIGRLMNDPSLFEGLDGTTREVQGLLKDFRANPKKFLTIQLKLW